MDYNILEEIDNETLEDVVDSAKDCAMYKGLLIRLKNSTRDTRGPVPFCLVPTPFPAQWFQEVSELQPFFNKVLHSIAYSRETLKYCLSSTLEVDEFTKNIFRIFEVTYREEQQALGLLRNDYLLDMNSDGNVTGIKQIENNTISTAFAGLAPTVRSLHCFTLEKLGQTGFEDKLPENNSVQEFAQGLISAWDAYGSISAAILVVIEDFVSNIYDQRAIEYTISEYESKLEVLRCTFKDLRIHAVLKENKLFVKDKEIAVVYYRHGYTPEVYEPEDWEVRLLLEQSLAIKCPSAGLHLAGTKRVQHFMGQPGFLEQFVDEDIAVRMRKVFARIYSLDMGEAGNGAVSLGITNPNKYVLKPEREGGGHNVYNEEVKQVLEKIGKTKERQGYILMERITPPEIANCIVVKDKKPTVGKVIAELGIFGVILGNKENIYMNNFSGHLLRSKHSHMDETGVTAGFGALDSPYLY